MDHHAIATAPRNTCTRIGAPRIVGGACAKATCATRAAIARAVAGGDGHAVGTSTRRATAAVQRRSIGQPVVVVIRHGLIVRRTVVALAPHNPQSAKAKTIAGRV